MTDDRGFRPEFLLNLDDRGPGLPDDDSNPYDDFHLDDWVLLLDGLSIEEREEYREMIPPEWRERFFIR